MEKIIQVKKQRVISNQNKQFRIYCFLSLIIYFLLFFYIKSVYAVPLKSPEGVINFIFNGWRLQNKTYMNLHSFSGGNLSSLGNMLSEFKLISYSIDWQKKYKNYVIIKTSIKTKSIKKSLKLYYIYWLLRKDDGIWKWEQGYVSGENMTYQYIYQIHKQ